MKKVKEKILDIFFTTVFLQIGLTLVAVACWFAVFHPLGQDLARGLLRGPNVDSYSESYSWLEWLIVIFSAMSASVIAIFMWIGYFKDFDEKRNPKSREDLVREIIEAENPDIDYKGVDNWDMFKKHDPNGLHRMNLHELNKYKSNISKKKKREKMW